MRRHGQISLFAVVGLIAAIAVVVALGLSNTDPPDAYLPEPYTFTGDVALAECIETTLANTILEHGRHAGYPESVANELETEGLAPDGIPVPYALLRPDEHEEGFIIDPKYLNPARSQPMNRFGKVKLLPVDGPISFESFLRTTARANLRADCSFEQGGEATITYEDVTAHIEPDTIAFTIDARHTGTGTLQAFESSHDVRLGRMHDDLEALLDRLATIPRYPINENEFSEEFSFTWTSRVLTLVDDDSELNGEPFALSISIEERFPMLKNLQCTAGQPELIHPDFDINPYDHVTYTCTGGVLEEATLTTSDGAARTITGVLGI